MPIYKYKCKDCDIEIELKQHMLDDPIKVCPACDGELIRVIQIPSVIYRGTGFYSTDKAPRDLEDLD